MTKAAKAHRAEMESLKGRTPKQIEATEKWLKAKAANKQTSEYAGASSSKTVVMEIKPKPHYTKGATSYGKGKTTAAAAAYALGQGAREPKVINKGRDGIRIVHRELVGSITGSVAFAIAQTVALNPGIAASFPWLATQAQGWEQYRFHMLRFCYYSRTGSSTPGSMMLIPDYDAADAAPDTESIASAYRDVQEQAPWVPEFCCQLNVKAMHPDGNRKFVRVGALAANLDIKTYDVGNFFAATTDGTAVNWGKLWVEYDCELFVPQLQPTGAIVISGGKITGNGTISSANPLGVTPTTAANASGISTNATSGVILANPGTYLFAVQYTGTGISGTSGITGGTGVTVTNEVEEDNGADTSAVLVATVTSTVANGVATITSSSTTTTACVVKVATAPSGSL